LDEKGSQSVALLKTLKILLCLSGQATPNTSLVNYKNSVPAFSGWDLQLL